MAYERGPLVLEVFGDGLFSRKLSLCLAGQTTSVYGVSFHTMSGPAVDVRRGDANGPAVGTCEFHSFTRKVDVFMAGGANTTIERDGAFSSKRDMQAFGRTLSFKHTTEDASLLGHNVKVVDAATNEVWLLYDSSSRNRRLEFRMGGLSQEQIDTLVVAIMGYVELERRNRSSGSAPAAGGGA